MTVLLRKAAYVMLFLSSDVVLNLTSLARHVVGSVLKLDLNE